MTVDPGDGRRTRVVEAAATLLASEGPHGLSLRRISTMAGGSTQLVYTLFGGKQGLADALYAEGFRRLSERMSAALVGGPPPGDPARLLALGLAYREFARTEPAFFSVMFGPAIPGFVPAAATRAAGRDSSFGHVVRETQQCLEAGTMAGAPAEVIARTCWVTGHGLASLEAAGLLASGDPDEAEAFALRVLQAPLDAHRP